MTDSGKLNLEREAAVGPSSNATRMPWQRKLRGSCDFCARRKKKCDGNGITRCSRCVAKNQLVCHYSECLPTGPRPQSSSLAPSSSSSSSRASTNGVPHALGTRDGGRCSGMYHAGQWQPPPGDMAAKAIAEQGPRVKRHRQSLGTVSRGLGNDEAAAASRQEAKGESRYAPLVALKRARLSPSPATGLVGLKENVYIGNFFRTLGFLPFTDESDIRKAMIATVLEKTQRQEEGNKVVIGGCAIAPSITSAEFGAAACVMWCSVALGCLVEGSPTESAMRYMTLAREALKKCFDDGSVGTARAYTSMAILQSFLGDEEKFKTHLDFARAIILGLPPGVAPVELKETILCVRLSHVCDPVPFDEEQSDLRRECVELRRKSSIFPACVEHPVKPKVYGKSELARWLMGLDVRREHSFREDMFHGGLFRKVKRQPRPKCATNSSDGCGEVREIWGSSTAPNMELYSHPLFSSPSVERVLQEDKDETEEPPPPGELSRTFATNALREIDAMEHGAMITNIRDGVGELVFRSTMAYARRVEGHMDDSLNNLMRCGEIIVQHPGLCRYIPWRHLMHCILNILAKEGNCDKYSELREIYNSMMDQPGTPKVPPFEEWSGMKDICNGVFCRSIASARNSKMSKRSNEHGILPCSLAEDDYLGGRNTCISPSPLPYTPQLLDVPSPEVKINGNARKDAGKEQRAVPIDATLISEGSECDRDEYGWFALANRGNAAADNSVKVPGGGGGRDWGEVNPASLGDGTESNGNAAPVGGGSFRSNADRNNSAGLWQGQPSVCFSSDNCMDGARDGNVPIENSDCNVLGFHTKQLVPLPLQTEGGVVWLEESAITSMIDALDPLLPEADIETSYRQLSAQLE